MDWSKRFSNGRSLFPVIWDEWPAFSLFVLPCVCLRPNGRRESRVQESDGSFFESYTALCWKQENRRLQVLREDDQPVVAGPEGESRVDPSQLISSKEVRSQHWFLLLLLYSCRQTLWSMPVWRVHGPFPTGHPPSWYSSSISWLPGSIRQTRNPVARLYCRTV